MWAACAVWSALSTAHGPAMKVNVPGPIGTRCPSRPTQTTERSGWCSRLTSLYGTEIRCTSATPGIARSSSPLNASTSPTSPMIVRTTPRLTKAWPPAASTRSTTCRTSWSVALALITTTMHCS